MADNAIMLITPGGLCVTSARLADIAPATIAEHMSDPRMAKHMPLLTGPWQLADAARFIAEKEAYWQRDGLGYWAFLCDGHYAGWGGLQKDGDYWDVGLVLAPAYWGLGWALGKAICAYACTDPSVQLLSFLLPPTRRHKRALIRLGCRQAGATDCSGQRFDRYLLDTPGPA